MVNTQVLGKFVIYVIVSTFVLIGSFQFVDENNALTLGGFLLFIGSLIGYVISISTLRKL